MPESAPTPPVSKYLFIPKQSIKELIDLERLTSASGFCFIFPYTTSNPPFTQIELRTGPETTPSVGSRGGDVFSKAFHLLAFEDYKIADSKSFAPGELYDLPFLAPQSPNAIKFRLVLFTIEDIKSLIEPALPPPTEIVGINFYYCETTVSIPSSKFRPFANIIAEQSLKKAVVKPGESPGDVGNPNTTIVLGYPCPPKWPQP